MMYMCVGIILALAGTGFAATTAKPGQPHLPSGPALAHIIDASFKNVDFDNDSFIEFNEFDTLIIVADTNNDGCMTLDEYKGFSAGTPEIATKIYQYFDTDNENCLTVDKVSDQFNLMDTNKDQKVTKAEFETYYTNLLRTLFSDKSTTVG